MIKTDNSKVNIELLAENERLREQLDAKREAWSSNNQFKAEIVKLREQLTNAKDKIPSIEKGCNRYGVDVSYFRKAINRELNISLLDFTPQELARVFARLSKTADESVMLEPEFNGSLRKQLSSAKADGIREAVYALGKLDPSFILNYDLFAYADELEGKNQ